MCKQLCREQQKPISRNISSKKKLRNLLFLSFQTRNSKSATLIKCTSSEKVCILIASLWCLIIKVCKRLLRVIYSQLKQLLCIICSRFWRIIRTFKYEMYDLKPNNCFSYLYSCFIEYPLKNHLYPLSKILQAEHRFLRIV